MVPILLQQKKIIKGNIYFRAPKRFAILSIKTILSQNYILKHQSGDNANQWE